jgi:hypothetical protein
MRKAPLVLLLLSFFAFLPAPATAAAELPGGKAYFVVSRGSFKTGTGNWMRLSDYTFTTDGKVRARTYLWQQAKPVARQGTGTTPDSSCSTSSAKPPQTLVRSCQVLTAGGFTSAPNESTPGNYRIEGDQLHITWDVPGWNEQWAVVPSPDGTLARLDFRSNALATAGYGYGSNTPLTTRRQMASVQSFPGNLRLEFHGWGKGSPTDGASGFDTGLYRTCTTTSWCLTYLQPESGNSCQTGSGCKASGDTSIQNHVVRVSNTDRRDTHWHWCSCLSINSSGKEEFCYKGNSHVKPMLQILDDKAQFRGWVGVEASFSPQGIREDDMLSAFRVADFR